MYVKISAPGHPQDFLALTRSYPFLMSSNRKIGTTEGCISSSFGSSFPGGESLRCPPPPSYSGPVTMTMAFACDDIIDPLPQSLLKLDLFFFLLVCLFCFYVNTRPGLHFSCTWKCSIISTAARQFFLFSCLAIPVLPGSGSEPRPHPLPTSVLPTHSRRTYTSLLTFNCKCARQSPVQPVF